MMPRQQEMEIPLLAALKRVGGQAGPQDVYPVVAEAFPEMTEADLAEQLQSGSTNKWRNRVQWVRQRLVANGEIESPARGIWSITDKGLARLRVDAERAQPPQSQVAPSPQSLEEAVDDYLSEFKATLLQKLHDLSPYKFEEFAGVLLRGYGFQKVEVTQKTKDGGIDGHGELKVGLAVVRAAFQCKNWQGTVGAPEIQGFRGAIQGQYEQGYVFTTSTFTRAAQAESIKMGAVPIILFDGEQIAQIMIEKGIGVRRRPVELYEDQIEELFESS